ncbi:hypothetical protein MLD38_037822 [Melastoma candidum]|uniref:Uncharacterized protein n=1 Tax=Melastoma candidum TaxID=119954 RepID=A0ACB9LNG8_9MYRT|nr:hypothetical protein MLD38_037822 [Melastoma candidum]
MIDEVPESIGRLGSLRKLNLQHNNIRRLPASICDLKNLQVLDASWNPLNEGIPEEIGSLSTLEYLDLSHSKVRFLPATVSQLSSLKSLILQHCDMLQELPGLPTSLTVLDASVCPLEKGIPEEIGSLSALEYLNLSCSKIRFLPARVSQLSSLKSLILHDCDILRELPGLPTSLIVLDASVCPPDRGIQEEICSLSALEQLDISGSKIRILPATVS